MLGSYPMDVMLLATDLGVARRFYGDTLGLPLLLEDTQFLTFGCGGDSRLVVTKSTTGTREAVTVQTMFPPVPTAGVVQLKAPSGSETVADTNVAFAGTASVICA